MTGHLQLLATGGTIAAFHDHGAWRQRPGAELLALVADPPGPIEVEDVHAGQSANLSTDDMLAVVERVQAAIAGGARGVVVTHGTDTLDQTAFLADMLVGPATNRVPVVVTGAMRHGSHPDHDGPANLADALRLADRADATGHSVVVCMDGNIHAARWVHKVHAQRIDAFSSYPARPVGHIDRKGVRWTGPGPRRPEVSPPPRLERPAPLVPLLAAYPGIPGEAFTAAVQGVRGIVVEGFGDLHLPESLWQPIRTAVAVGVVVVLASRAHNDTTTNEDLEALGAVGACGLSAPKARLALTVALGTHDDPARAVALLRRLHMQCNAD